MIIKFGKQRRKTLLAESLMSFKAVRLVRDLPFEVAAWWCGATAAGVIICAVGDVLFGNLGTCALVNFLPTDLAGELLAALGYAALPAKNLMLTDVPLCWLPS